MKCVTAKHSDLLLKQAINHYRKSSDTFTFLSLHSDFEPYPISDVVAVIKLKISDLESELEPWRKLGREQETLETQLYALKKHLKRMEQRQGEITDEH